MANSQNPADPQPGAPVAAGPLRYAHPYYTTTPPASRPAHGQYGQRALDWSSQQVGPIPPPRGNSVMALSDVIGEEGAQSSLPKVERFAFMRWAIPADQVTRMRCSSRLRRVWQRTTILTAR